MELFLSKFAVMLIPALFAIMLHEVAHGYAAERFGDPTARLLGRLTFNPFKHLDPIGTLAVFLIGFGWAKPVPVNAENFRRPRRDMIWVALAGPFSNFVLALFSAALLHGFSFLENYGVGGAFYAQVATPLRLMAAFSLLINTIFATLNMIPIPPLDGGRILIGLLPERHAARLSRLEPFGFFFIMIIMIASDVGPSILFSIALAITALMAGSEMVAVQQAIQFLFIG